MGHKASKVSEGPLSQGIDHNLFIPQRNLDLRRKQTYFTQPEQSRKSFYNSNNSNEVNSTHNRSSSAFEDTSRKSRYSGNHRSQVSFSQKGSNPTYVSSLDMMKKVVSHTNANSNHSSQSDSSEETESSDEKVSADSCTPPTSNYRSLKDRRSRSLGKKIIQTQDEQQLEKCLFNVLHRKDSQRFCRGSAKTSTLKASKDSNTIVLSDGRLYNRTQELIKDTQKNVEFASDRVTDFKRLAATLEQMDASLQTLPKRLANGFSKILDFDVFSEVDENLQMEIISTARNSCTILGDTIPSLQKHIENIRDIQMILIRTEERLDTFCKALYQMFHLPDLNTTVTTKKQPKRDFLKTAFKSKK